ncbi:MAG: hypothetical protein AB1500_05250 [Bacillota bacterium]
MFEVPNMQAKIVNLCSNLQLAPQEQVTFEELKATVLIIAFRIESDGNLLLYIEGPGDPEWAVMDKTACYTGTTMWQCLLKKPDFRARVKNVSGNPVSVTIDLNMFERVAAEE